MPRKKNAVRIKRLGISFSATPEEVSKLQSVMRYHRRRSFADTIRFLLEVEAEKILPDFPAIAEK